MTDPSVVAKRYYEAGGYKLVDVCRAFGLDAWETQAVYYIFRWRRKGNGVRDLRAAQFYIEKLIEENEAPEAPHAEVEVKTAPEAVAAACRCAHAEVVWNQGVQDGHRYGTCADCGASVTKPATGKG